MGRLSNRSAELESNKDLRIADAHEKPKGSGEPPVFGFLWGCGWDNLSPPLGSVSLKALEFIPRSGSSNRKLHLNFSNRYESTHGWRDGELTTKKPLVFTRGFFERAWRLETAATAVSGRCGLRRWGLWRHACGRWRRGCVCGDGCFAGWLRRVRRRRCIRWRVRVRSAGLG